MHGYHGRILNVNLSSGHVAIETFDETFARQYLGGNGFAIRLLYERLAAGIDPLAPDNMVVFAVGPTTDTAIPGATRPEYVTGNVGRLQTPIPADLWAELKSEALLRPDAPVPGR